MQAGLRGVQITLGVLVFHSIRLCVVACCLGALAPVIQAQASVAADDTRISLKAAIESAWQRSVQAREAAARQRQAGADRSAADSLWARSPALEIGHRADGPREPRGGRESELGLSWPLWLPGQQTARQALAQVQEQLAQDSASVLKLRLAGEVREQAWGLHLLQAELQQAEAQVGTLRQLVADVERRVQAGDLARADAMAARAESLAATALHSEAGQRLAEARARWQLLTGQMLAPELGVPTAPGQASLDESHPELVQARRQLEWRRSQLELLRHSRREAPELALSYRQEQGAAGSIQDSVGVKLRLPLSTQDRNLPLEAAALGELEVAETNAQRLHEQLAGALVTTHLALRNAQERLAAERERAHLLQERAQLLHKAFQAGELPLPELLRALSAASQAQAAQARQQAALGLAQARYQQALGWLP